MLCRKTAGDIFAKRQFFKLVCGAGNEDPTEVRRLCYVYSLAGASGIDMSASVEIVSAAMAGIDLAERFAGNYKQMEFKRPLLTVSVGLKGDPHVRKAVIDSGRCTQCNACREACLQGAISVTAGEYCVETARCIGCGACSDVCPMAAVSFFNKRRELDVLIPELLAAGAESVELHAATEDEAAFRQDWESVCRLTGERYVSLCLDRSRLSNKQLLERVVFAYQSAGDRCIIQADGDPMSGGKDDFRTTLQTLATADIVTRAQCPVKILASGGTNSRTGELARLCGVPIHGVSLGTFARMILREELPLVEDDDTALFRAVDKARRLVEGNLKELAAND